MAAEPGEPATPAAHAEPPEALERGREPPPRREPDDLRGGRKGRALVVDGMVRIPGSDFLMGQKPRFGEPNELPAHKVRVAPFWIDRTEVTVGDFGACVARGSCQPPIGRAAACTFGRATAPPSLPVNCVSWHNADGFCRAHGKRLPTEAEWELAAGAGSGTRYPWGSSPPTCQLATTLTANHAGKSCSPEGPAPVGRHPQGASPFDVLDMAGNVEEWVADWYADRYVVGPPSETPTHAPAGPAFGVAHVLRGGGWMSRPRDARTTARSWGSPNEAGPNIGFRCARD